MKEVFVETQPNPMSVKKEAVGVVAANAVPYSLIVRAPYTMYMIYTRSVRLLKLDWDVQHGGKGRNDSNRSLMDVYEFYSFTAFVDRLCHDDTHGV